MTVDISKIPLKSLNKAREKAAESNEKYINNQLKLMRSNNESYWKN